MSLPRWLAYALIALTVAMMLSALGLSLVTGTTFATDDWGTDRVVFAMFFCAVVYPAVGALIVLRGRGTRLAGSVWALAWDSALRRLPVSTVAMRS